MIVPLLAHRWVVAGGFSQLTVGGMVELGMSWLDWARRCMVRLLRVSLSWPVMLMQYSMPGTSDRESIVTLHTGGWPLGESPS